MPRTDVKKLLKRVFRSKDFILLLPAADGSVELVAPREVDNNRVNLMLRQILDQRS